MFSPHAAQKFLKRFSLLSSFNGHQAFCCWNRSSFKSVHSLHQCKGKNRPIRSINRHTRKTVKLAKKENDVDPKVYTRDTIRHISNILRYSTWDSAEEQLQKLQLRWDSYTINQILKTHPPMEKAWLFFVWASRLRGFKHDQFTYTTMLDIFGEAKRISSMNYVFKQMQENGIKIDAVTYTSLLHWLSNDGDIEGAVKLWEEMIAKGCRPTVVSYTAYMKVLFQHNRVKEAAKVYKEMLHSGLPPNCHTYTVLMEHLAGSGKYKEVLEIFSKMQDAGVRPDKAACNILVEKCCKAGEISAMTQILQYMKENHLVLRYSVYLEALEILKIAGGSDVHLLKQVNPHFCDDDINCEDRNGFSAISADTHSTVDGELMLNLLTRKNFVAVDCLVAGIMDKNIRLDSWIVSSIIETNSTHSRQCGALLAYEYGVRMGISINPTAYISLIGILIRANSFAKGVEVAEDMVRGGHSLGTSMAALLIHRLGLARKPVFAARIFTSLPDDQKNTATYTALIGAYFFCRSADKALKVIETMREKKVCVSLGTYNVILAGLEKCGRVCELETYRKEKKNLQAGGRSQYTPSPEETICDCLFA